MRDLEFGPWAMAGSIAAVVAMGWWLPAVPVVLAGLTVLVLLHEGGHLVAARRTGMLATEFFAGFGPVVFAWRTTSGLRVGLKAIPAGGYVKVVGMTGREKVDPALEAQTFRAGSRGRRLAVVAAGPVVNLAFGLLLLVGAAAADPLPGQAGGPARRPRRRPGTPRRWSRPAPSTGVGDLVTDLDGYVATLGDPADRADEAPTRFLSPVGVAQISDEVADSGMLDRRPPHRHRVDRPRRDEPAAAAAPRRRARRRRRHRVAGVARACADRRCASTPPAPASPPSRSPPSCSCSASARRRSSSTSPARSASSPQSGVLRPRQSRVSRT